MTWPPDMVSRSTCLQNHKETTEAVPREAEKAENVYETRELPRNMENP